MLGMNMKVEKVSLDRVKQKLLNMKRKPEVQTITEEDLEKRLEELERKAEEEKLQRKNKNFVTE